jgi:SLOG in TRPM, prokaryote
MAERFDLALSRGGRAHAVTIEDGDDLRAAIESLGLGECRVSVALIGGASQMSDSDLERARPVVRDVLAPFVEARGGVVLDGGTDTGVFRLIGRERAAASFAFPLVGVLPARLAALPGRPRQREAAPLEPNHTHFVLVPGTTWGDEVLWLAQVAGLLAAGGRAVTVLLNGGELAWEDVEASVAAERPVVVLAGSGRAADELAAGLTGSPGGLRAARLVASGLLHRIEVDAADELAVLLDRLLARPAGPVEAQS